MTNYTIPGTPSGITSRFVPVARVLWTNGCVTNAESLVGSTKEQVSFDPRQDMCTLKSTDQPASILLDFGTELHGLVRLIVRTVRRLDNEHVNAPCDIRVRFGESANEAMAEFGEKNTTNDHINRDYTLSVMRLSMPELGPTGFRFLRLDLLTPHAEMMLEGAIGILRVRDLPYLGSFACSDEQLDRIWQVGAYTVQLCMQDYIWDGIKRDRLVWLGDMHPETSTVQAVFGPVDVVRRSLDLARDTTPLPEYMNTIESYSIWWIRIHREQYLHYGDRAYLEAQRSYMAPLLRQLCDLVDETGRTTLSKPPFIEWPSGDKDNAKYEGFHGLLSLGLRDGAELMDILGESDTAALARETRARLLSHKPVPGGYKQTTAMAMLGGVVELDEGAQRLMERGPWQLSTFWGFYTLCALAESGNVTAALADIRAFWGAMLQRGATTFWEDFSLDWLLNAGRIDELTPAGMDDLHGDRGDYCYVGFRHSLCHGWASGPTAFLSQYVLGVHVTGVEEFTVKGELGDLEWAEGDYPTARGVIHVRHERTEAGVKTTVRAPEGVTVKVLEG